MHAFHKNICAQGISSPQAGEKGEWLAIHMERRCEITIISFSRSICRGGLAALIGVTGKPYPSCLSCHSHPIRPCGHLPLERKATIREYHLLKKGGEAATRALNLEPNESKVKRGCEEMRIHFFIVPFIHAVCFSLFGYPDGSAPPEGQVRRISFLPGCSSPMRA